VVLGYVDPDSFWGGQKKLKKDLAEKIIQEKVAHRLGIPVPQAAFAIYKVFNSFMASGISHAFITKGFNPGDFVYCAGGSAGPLCALKISEELDMEKVMIPKHASTYSAFGMLNVDVKHSFSRHYSTVVADYDLNVIKRLYQEMEDEGTSLLEKDGVPKDQRILARTLRMRYFGQFREIEVAWPSGPITKETVAQGVTHFHRRHKELFGSCNENYPLQFMTFCLTAIGKMPKVLIKKMDRGHEDISSALKTEREAYFEETDGFTKTRIYDGGKLFPDTILEGPCIVEEENMSIVIPPGFRMRVDDYGNYVAP
jgi:N-methylhydantoinase A